MKDKTKIVLGAIIGGLSAAALVGIGFILNLDSIREEAQMEAEDFFIESIKEHGWIQLEHSKTGEPLVVSEDKR